MGALHHGKTAHGLVTSNKIKNPSYFPAPRLSAPPVKLYLLTHKMHKNNNVTVVVHVFKHYGKTRSYYCKGGVLAALKLGV